MVEKMGCNVQRFDEEDERTKSATNNTNYIIENRNVVHIGVHWTTGEAMNSFFVRLKYLERMEREVIDELPQWGITREGETLNKSEDKIVEIHLEIGPPAQVYTKNSKRHSTPKNHEKS